MRGSWQSRAQASEPRSARKPSIRRGTSHGAKATIPPPARCSTRVWRSCGTWEIADGIAVLLGNLGLISLEQGDLATAGTFFEESLATMRELGERVGIANALNNLGIVAYRKDNYSAAWALHQEALSIRREIGDRKGIASALNNLGLVALGRADYPAARALLEESTAIAHELGDRSAVASSLGNLGMVASAIRDFASAKAHHQQSLSICAELGEGPLIADALAGVSTAAAGSGDSLRAARIWGAEERLREEIGLPLQSEEQRDHDRSVAAARAALGDDAAFDHAWQDGRALTLEQAIELALEKAVEQP